DIEWKIKKQNKSTAKFEFDIDESNIIIPMKCFIIHGMESNLSPDYILSAVRRIKKDYKFTDGFSVEKFKEYEEMFIKSSKRIKEDIVLYHNMFSEYYEQYLPSIYLNLFKIKFRGKHNARTLPNYDSVLKFEYILNDYFENVSYELRKRFFPLFLWWKVTTIIPLRPEEFLDIKSSCLSMYNERYFITIPRKKKKGKMAKIPITDTLQINKDTYDLINEYLDMQTEEEKGEYLFSYLAYHSFLPESHKKQAVSRRNRIDKMDNEQLRELIDDFYLEVIEESYKYVGLERLKLGDTRHFAFCNMRLQGFNALSIARIGGHDNLSSQVHYHSHSDYFAQAKVKVLSDIIQRNRKKDLGECDFLDSTQVILRSKILKNFDGMKEVEEGYYCKDKEFPNNCIKECIQCDYSYLDLDNPKVKNKLKCKSLEFNNEIELVIETMQELSKNMLYDIEMLMCSDEEQEKLFTLANKLEQLINEKANVDSYL
ncbi:MAG: tyrosine-type recombinase/integrase, partial [Terrisporobacter sp.]